MLGVGGKRVGLTSEELSRLLFLFIVFGGNQHFFGIKVNRSFTFKALIVMNLKVDTI